MFFSNSIALIISLLGIIVRTCAGCHDLRNVLMEVREKHGERFNLTLSGCIQRSSFDGKTITEIHVRHQNIPKLDVDNVKHLIHLDTLEFKDCRIKSIVPGAFRNLLEIRVIEITHNFISEITAGVFDIFDTIKILKLNNNKITSISDEALSNMTVTDVDFSHNELTIWKIVWFAHSPNIQRLDLSYNLITTIPKKAFESMPLLEVINFQHNRLNYIEPDAFQNINSLSVLNLKSNRLTSINDFIFRNKIAIFSLNLAANDFFDLQVDLLDKLSLNDITLDRNPWLCPCLAKIYDWLNKNNVILKKADNCNLDNLPVCLAVEKCEFPRSTQSSTLYKRIIDNLHRIDRECIGL